MHNSREGQMSKKLSIIRFKPKPEHYDDFLQDVIENGKERDPGTHFVMKKDDEVIAIVIRDSEGFEQNAQDGVVNWLDERRPMLQEFDHKILSKADGFALLEVSFTSFTCSQKILIAR